MVPDRLLASIVGKRAQLGAIRPLSGEALAKLEHYYDIELTYTSNAIEGNTLSPVETTLVIEKGVTISGKPLKDHLEALDHFDAIGYVRVLARESTPLTEGDVRNSAPAHHAAFAAGYSRCLCRSGAIRPDRKRPA
jgi:Fic family protein